MQTGSFIGLYQIHDCLSNRQKNYEKHHCSEILWVKSCEPNVFHQIDGEQIPLLPNTIYLIGKDQIHHLHKSAKGMALCFENDFFVKGDFSNLRVLFSPLINEGITLDKPQRNYLTKIIVLISIELNTSAQERILVAYLVALLNKINLFRPDIRSASSRSMHLEAFVNLVDMHYSKNKKVGFYAQELGMSEKKLNSIVKSKLGYPVSQYLSTIVLLESKRRLRLNSKNVNDVSTELGFKDQAYFSRFFKKHTGKSPQQFIQELADR